jgi:hypothetical protein
MSEIISLKTILKQYFPLGMPIVFVSASHTYPERSVSISIHGICYHVHSMTSSGGLLSETLQSITTTKLKELSKKRTIYEDHRQALLVAIQLVSDPSSRLRVLIDGVKTCFSVTTGVQRDKNRTGRVSWVNGGSTNDPALEVKLRNMERFLGQARYDPSLSAKLIQSWEQSLMQRLNIQTLRYQYASLYGQLVTEWLSAKQTESAEAPVLTSDVEMLEDYEEVAAAKRIKSRQEWEHFVFEPSNVDDKAIIQYLEALFGKPGSKKEAFKALNELRQSIDRFETQMALHGQLTHSSLKWVISGLLNSDLLTNEKRSVLRDFNSNPVILSEIADVLNMRLSALDSWSWEGNVAIEQRRKLDGKYSICMHEDLLQAIFLQYLGVKWSVFFKKTFTAFYEHEGAWVPLRKPPPRIDKNRRDYFLHHHPIQSSVQSKRESIYRSRYFMAQLLDSENQEIQASDGDEEADSFSLEPKVKKRKGIARPSVGGKRARRIAPQHESEEEDEEDEQKPKTKNVMDAKQDLLHLLSAEITINTHLHKEITCVRSEFDSWMPSIPHTTIYTVLRFFGVSGKWIGFLEKFLEAPLKFVDDEDSEAARVRKSGVPESHVLSEVLGEVVLFCLDYSVNQRTEGSRLHRLHDGFWIWSSNHQTCVKAWEAITIFAEVMGVTIDEHKTATVRITRDNKNASPAEIDPSLIPGDIRWGFLCLDPVTGRFKIDQAIVDHHIADLHQQLSNKTGSLFSWVQAWNVYATTFFTTNFGKPANCYGRDHVEQMLTTFTRIQRKLFPSDDTSNSVGGVVEYLKTIIQQRFGLEDIPDGYLFFPTDIGGLELQNPFIGLLQIRDSLIEDPSSLMEDFEEVERDAYVAAKKKFDDSRLSLRVEHVKDFRSEEGEVFLSFEEFTKFREDFAGEYEGELADVFDTLLKTPHQDDIEPSVEVMSALDALNKRHTTSQHDHIGNWRFMVPYWKWVTQLYGPEMIENFGGLSVVDRGELPIGMVNLFRSGRVKWQE